jgi:hypothetical protein
VQETRTELQTGRDMLSIAHRRAQTLQRPQPAFGGVDICKERKVIAVVEPCEVRFEPAFKR